jgi:hypothetical protein
MNDKKDIDPEMLENLDLLLDYEVVENDQDLEGAEQLEALEKIEPTEVKK